MRSTKMEKISLLHNFFSQYSFTSKYYRMTQIRKACLEAVPTEVVEQAIVPIPINLITIAEQGCSKTEVDSFLELESNGITVRVTKQTSTELLSKVLRVIAYVK